MALVKCVECSNKISDTAKICPSCGCDIKLFKENRNVGIALYHPGTKVSIKDLWVLDTKPYLLIDDYLIILPSEALFD